jgi:hypothetical protein
LQSYDRNITDFISIYKKGEKLRVGLKMRIEKKLSLVLKQEDRVLCNGKVFFMHNLTKSIQNLETDDEIVGGLALNRDVLILGHSSFGQISIWKWHRGRYDMIKKTKLLQGMQENNIHLTHFQLSLTNQNEIYLSS